MAHMTENDIRKAVLENYGKVADSDQAGCGCTPSSCCQAEDATNAEDISIALGYSHKDVSSVPQGANMGLGCGNPQQLASLRRGDTVLDLGSGGGFDCFLAAQAVGYQGQVIGVDMTPEMVHKARRNAENDAVTNIEFRLGEIEHLPVANETIDVLISNCVINLSPEKDQVFREAFRVLKPGGRLAISDMVATAELPDAMKRDIGLHVGCRAGASPVHELKSIMDTVGFRDIHIRTQGQDQGENAIDATVISATIEAKKPMNIP